MQRVSSLLWAPSWKDLIIDHILRTCGREIQDNKLIQDRLNIAVQYFHSLFNLQERCFIYLFFINLVSCCLRSVRSYESIQSLEHAEYCL